MNRTPAAPPPIHRSGRATPVAAVRRAVSWHRRKLAVLAAVVAVFAGVNAATPEPPPTVQVVVATRQLAGGVRLQPSDLRAVRVPTDLAPERAVHDPADLVGRTVVAPVTGGTVFTALSVLSPRLTRASPGSVIVAVKLADPALVQLLGVGDRVDVLVATADAGAGTPTASVVAAGALLVTVPAPPTGSGPIGGGGAGDATGVLVQVDASTAVRLTQAAATGPLTVVLR